MALTRITVGLDGSPSSVNALGWASGLADATKSSLRALGAWRMPLIASMPSLLDALPSHQFMADQAADRLEKAIADAGFGEEVERVIQEADPGAALASETGGDNLVVVGRTGLGRRHGVARFAEIVLGSAARYCIHHASGPVAAVPADQQWVVDPTVVVGVDGSPSSHAALAWAAENLPESAKIYAVRAVPPVVDGLLPFDHTMLNQILEAADKELDTSIQSSLKHLGADAAARVEPLVVVESARHALIDPGFDVHLVVVGERGRGAVAARVLGSISDHVVRYAPCPVVVVPGPEESE